MKRRKIIWLLLAATLWFWAALVAGVIFPELPVLFDSPNIKNLAGLSAQFELYLYGALALFLVYFNPSRKIWVATFVLGAFLLLKGIWLAPLLLSSLQWEYPPLSLLPIIYAATELIKFVLLLITSSWIFSEITIISRVEKRYKNFIHTRKSLKNHLSQDQKMNKK